MNPSFLLLGATETVAAAEHVLGLAGTAETVARFPTEPLVATSFPWLWLIPALPALGALINLAFGAYLQRTGRKSWTSTLAIGVMVLATLFAWLVILPKLVALPAANRLLEDQVWTMFAAGSLHVNMAFAIDPLSMVMVLVVLTIATSIHIYSIGYMGNDSTYWKFFVYLNYFVFSMLLLVMGDNFVVMFFGWEGVGLASYLLIGFWHEDIAKAQAGLKAFLVNRIGDFGFILGLFALFWGLGGSFQQGQYQPDAETFRHSVAAPTVQVGEHSIPVGPTLSFKELRNQVVIQETGVGPHLVSMKLWGLPFMAVVCILFFIGATGKSAQIPLFIWLPDAMAGPTPVSALIHAATMVTAGVYMIARLNFLFALSPIAMTVVAMVGGLTAFFAATVGLFQHDIKKVLAYSTISQLGYMFVGVGIGAYWLAIFHLVNHACFKACLFLGSGSVIEGCHHEQDMRKMGGLKRFMPITRWTYVIATLAIIGFPLANGFYSKDEILWKALTGENLLLPGWIPWLLGLLGALGTSYYMWRSYFFTFEGEYRGDTSAAPGGEPAQAHTPHESPKTMRYVLIFLAGLSVLTIVLGLPHAFGFHPFLEEWLAPVMAGSKPLLAFHALGEDPEAIEWTLIAVGGLLIPLFGYIVARRFYIGPWVAMRDRLAAGERVGPFKASLTQPIYRLIYDKYRVDELYAWAALRPLLRGATLCASFDRLVIDGAVNLAGLTGRIVCELSGAFDKRGVDGLVMTFARGLSHLGQSMQTLQARNVRTYLYSVLGGALVIVLINYVLF